MRSAWTVALLVTLAAFGIPRPVSAQEAIAPPPASSLSGLGFSRSPGDSDGSMQLAGLSLMAEFLYLRPNREGLGMAVVSTTSGGITSSTLESLSWDGTPAFRLGGHYRLPDSGVELAASFTYFHARTQRDAFAPEGGSLLGALATDRRARDSSAADGDAGLSYAVLDLEARNSARIHESLDLRAFGGVRLASINQTLKCIYSGGALGDASDFVNSPIRFRGAGLTAGAEATWDLYRGWGFYGRGRLGLMSGAFNSRRTETVGPTLVSDESETYYTVIPVAELGAGLAYHGESFFFSAGYEVTDWLNMVSGVGGPGSNVILQGRKRGDLTLEALAVKLGFAF